MTGRSMTEYDVAQLRWTLRLDRIDSVWWQQASANTSAGQLAANRRWEQGHPEYRTQHALYMRRRREQLRARAA
jgi:hypothetical protein